MGPHPRPPARILPALPKLPRAAPSRTVTLPTLAPARTLTPAQTVTQAASVIPAPTVPAAPLVPSGPQLMRRRVLVMREGSRHHLEGAPVVATVGILAGVLGFIASKI